MTSGLEPSSEGRLGGGRGVRGQRAGRGLWGSFLCAQAQTVGSSWVPGPLIRPFLECAACLLAVCSVDQLA